MRGDLVDRRFTDEEARRIFERAAEADARPSAAAGQEGLTLAELRAIASEVGLDAAAVDTAAAEIIASSSSPRVSQLSTLIHEEVVISKPLSNGEMRQLTSQVEQIIGRRGLLSETGAWVEWRDSKDRLYVGMVRGDRQTRLRAIANSSAEMVVGSAVIGILGLMLLPGISGGSWIGAVAVVVVTLGLIGLFLRNRRDAGRRDLQELLHILAGTADH